ncbi:uncharacterized protein B0H64DRAFT_20797 [Chaetomium fimeti]|uniref:Uncharacterized protein n=1 Tax=Chaetomium fimeti TaxID=1854472 RepID=A0AAE0HQ61_9PEZI|nr:hypothetical protein B0H64DRAFT_20797 [Chaetomium fimeti]
MMGLVVRRRRGRQGRVDKTGRANTAECLSLASDAVRLLPQDRDRVYGGSRSMRWGGCRAMRQIDGSCVPFDAPWVGCAPSPVSLVCRTACTVICCIVTVSASLCVVSQRSPAIFPGDNTTQHMAASGCLSVCPAEPLGLDMAAVKVLVGLCSPSRLATDVTSRQKSDGNCEGCGCCVTTLTARKRDNRRRHGSQRLQPSRSGPSRGRSPFLLGGDLEPGRYRLE